MHGELYQFQFQSRFSCNFCGFRVQAKNRTSQKYFNGLNDADLRKKAFDG